MIACSESRPLLEVRNLAIEIPTDDGPVLPVQDVSFSIPEGGTLGLVGESGCGKSMTGLALLQLVPRPGRVSYGEIRFHGRDGVTDIAALQPDSSAIRAIRGKEIAMIFQEPMSSLNPVYSVGAQIAEMVRIHRPCTSKDARAQAIEMLRKVGIASPEIRVDEYPHQLSGGMRQRAVIAMALSCGPRLLIADEPTTALDVTVQAQILDLIRELQMELGTAVLMVSHDLGVIADICNRVVVMYAGQVVEEGSVDQIFYNPQHPYTRGLLKSAPAMGSRVGERLYSIPGTVPGLLSRPRGCTFRPRCPERSAICLEKPELTNFGEGQQVRCWARQREQASGVSPEIVRHNSVLSSEGP